MEIINLTPTLTKEIKQAIDKRSKNEIKPSGFDEFVGYYAKGFLTKGQANKILSFYNTFKPSDHESQEKKQLYDEVHILPFVKVNLDQISNREKLKSKMKSMASVTQKRTVDRMNSRENPSVKPPTIDPDPTAVNETILIQNDIDRIVEIIRKSGTL